MAEKTNEQLAREILEVQLETAKISLAKARSENQAWHEREESHRISNSQRQAHLENVAAQRDAIQRVCLHKQGGGPEDRYEGDGKSCLTLARIFFSNNFLIQCPRCDLALQRPHPKRKSTKPVFEGETQTQIKRRIEIYNEDVTRYEALLREAKSNKLRPMLGPTWEFANEDGDVFTPEMK
jgi:hypothetical protein